MRARRSLLRGLATLGLLAGVAWAGLASPGEPAGTGRGGEGPPVATPSLDAEAADLAVAVAPAPPVVQVGVETLGTGTTFAPPAQPSMAAAYRTAAAGDDCVDRDLAAPEASDVIYTLLDRTYALPPTFAPPDLVSAAEAGFAADQLVHAALVDDLASLRTAAVAAGHAIQVESAYRSFAAQAATFDQFVATYGYAEALIRAARPGHSEHQLGTAFDFTSAGWEGRVGDWATESAAGAWMAEHAWEHGFVMSYPVGSQAATCFSYEPWHYRWIGRAAAAAQRASGEPLRTFLVRYLAG